MVQRLLTEEQKVQRVNVCAETSFSSSELEANEKFLENIITGEKLWIF